MRIVKIVALFVFLILLSSSGVFAEEDLEGRVSAFLQRYAAQDAEVLPAGARAAAWKQLEANIAAKTLKRESAEMSTYLWEQLEPGWLSGEGGERFTGRVTAIAVHPQDDNVVFIGTANGGVWKTLNGGADWTAETDHMETLAIGSLEIATSGSETIVYAGTGEGKLYCDTYYGQGLLRGEFDDINQSGEWSLSDNLGHFAQKSIKTIQVHPLNADWIIVGTASGALGWVGHDEGDCLLGNDSLEVYGVWGSSDRGETWTAEPLFDARDPFSSTYSGTDFITDLEFTDAPQLNQGTFLVAVADTYYGPGDKYGGIYRITVQWPAVVSDPPFRVSREDLFVIRDNPVSRIELARSPNSNSRVYGISANGDHTWGGLYMSEEPFSSWVPLNDPDGTNQCQSEYGASYAPVCDEFGNHPDPRVAACCDGPFTIGCTVVDICERANGIRQCSYDLVLEVDSTPPPTPRDRIWLGGIGLWRGIVSDSIPPVEWDDMCTSVLHVDQQALAFGPAPNSVWVANDGGIARFDSVQALWTTKNTDNLNLVQFYPGASLYSASTELLSLAGTQDNGVLRFKSGESTPWLQILPFADGGPTAMTPDFEDSHWFAGIVKNYVYGSRDAGSTWERTIWQYATEWVYPFKVCENPDTLLLHAMMAKGSKVYMFDYDTRPPRLDVSLVYDHTDSQIPDWIDITALEYVPSLPHGCNTFWVGLRNGALYWTDDPGAPWTHGPYYPLGLGSGDFRAVTSIAINPIDADHVVVSYGGFNGPHIFESFNAMQASPDWAQIDASPGEKGDTVFDQLPDVPVHKVLITSIGGGTILAGTDIGVFSTSDSGVSWVLLDNGHPNSPVYDLVESNGDIVSFTHGRGAWRLVVDDATVQVTRPNGGDAWEIGDQEQIIWTASSSIQDVRIEIQRTLRGPWVPIVERTPAGDGSFTWPVSWPPTAYARIKILDADNPAVSDTSDAVFSIVGGQIPYYADTFSGGDPGAGLSGRLTEMGQGTWEASPGLVLSNSSSVTGEGRAGLIEPPIENIWHEMTVVAKIDPTGSGWVGLGYSDSATGPYWDDGLVWAIVRPDGRWTVFHDGTTTTLGNGIVTLSPGDLNTVELTYSRKGQYVVFRINGATVLKAKFEPWLYVPYIGMHILNGIVGQTFVDDFGVYQD